MKKKAIQFMAGTCCAVLFLASCSPGATETTGVDNNTGIDATEPDSNNNDGETDPGQNSGDLDPLFVLDEPLVPEKITMTAVTRTNPFVQGDFNDFEMWGILEQATNIAWEIDTVMESAYEERVTLLIQGNDLPDVFFTAGADIQGRYYNTGQFLALDDLIDEHAPAMAELLSDTVIRANIASPDGQVYVTPTGEIAPWLDDGNEIFVNGEWLEKLNLEVPETLDEFTEMLRAFRDEDPNGNNLADEIPLMMNIQGGDLMRFMGLFGLPINADYMMMRDQEFIYGPTEDEFRNALEFFNTLYSENLLDPESLSQDRSDLMAKGSTSPAIVGVLVGFWALDFSPPEIAEHFVAIPPVAGGMDGEPEWLPHANIPGPGGLSITSEAEHPEAIMKWANYLVENPKRTFEIAEGPSSSQLIYLNEEDKWVQNIGGEPEGMTYNEWSFSTALRNSIPWYLTGEDVLEIRAVEGEALLKLNFVEQYRPYFYEQILTPAHLNNFDSEEERQEVLTIRTDMGTIVQEFIAQSLMNGVTDGSWKSFQDTLESARVQRLIELYQNSLEVYFTNNP